MRALTLKRMIVNKELYIAICYFLTLLLYIITLYYNSPVIYGHLWFGTCKFLDTHETLHRPSQRYEKSISEWRHFFYRGENPGGPRPY